MRPAPPVTVSCSGGVLWRAVRAVLPSLAAGALTAFGLLHLERPGWPAALVLAGTALVAWRLARPSVRDLRWDGQAWSIDGEAGELAVMIDVGPALLLRLKPVPKGPAHWIAVTQSEAAPAWHALRAAVYSRPSKPTAPRVRPPERTAD